MIRLTRDGTAEPVSRDQILRCKRGQGNVYFPCSAGHEQDWQSSKWVTCTPAGAEVVNSTVVKQDFYSGVRSGKLCLYMNK